MSLSLHYMQYGDSHNPLFVFLHGGGVSGYMWEEQVKYFSKSFHCIVPDLPGQGKSQFDEPFTISKSSTLINDLIVQLAGEKKVIVTGFSLGAQVLVEMLAQQPELIHYAIINSALVKPMPSAKLWLKPMLAVSLPLTRSKFFAKLQAKELYIPSHQFEQYYEESKHTALGNLLSVMHENMSFSIPQGYRAATTKILVTVGMREKKMMRQSAEALVAQGNNCTGIIFPNIGHGIPLANPGLFNSTIDQWLSDKQLAPELLSI